MMRWLTRFQTLVWLCLLPLLAAACVSAESPSDAASAPGPAPTTAAQPEAVPPLEEESTAVPTTAAAAPAVTAESTVSSAARKANADVVFVLARQETEDSWRFTVTVEHPDLGWDDYADGWDVVLPDGTVVLPDPDSPFTRLLLHPHENEQPFTRSQGGISIPPEISTVTVRAHDLVDGFGGQEISLELDSDGDQRYEVQRLAD